MSYVTVETIKFLAGDSHAASPVSPVASDMKKLPPLKDSVLATLVRLNPAELREAHYNNVRLERRDAIELRDWCRKVAELMKSRSERVLLLAGANAIDVALL
jgi:hypothetical protein